jgi:ribosomal protein S27AE
MLHDSGGLIDSGAAYVFMWSGTTWTEQQKLTASNAGAGDLFGSTLAIDKDCPLRYPGIRLLAPHIPCWADWLILRRRRVTCPNNLTSGGLTSVAARHMKRQAGDRCGTGAG